VCGPCPVFAGFTLAFALQLRKKHGKTSGIQDKVKVRCYFHAMKASGGVELQIRPFLNLVLDGNDWTASVLSPWNLNPVPSEEESSWVSEPVQHYTVQHPLKCHSVFLNFVRNLIIYTMDVVNCVVLCVVCI